MPKQLTSDAEVVEYVSKTKGAIGYVNSTIPTEGVKTLIVLAEENKFQRMLLKRMEPEYPEALKIRHISGTVRLLLTVSPKGNVENVEVVGGNPIFAETAAKAARLWVYTAAPSQTKIEVNIAFEPGS
jgi:TonB family protein